VGSDQQQRHQQAHRIVQEADDGERNSQHRRPASRSP
jgi:hypothetical protein